MPPHPYGGRIEIPKQVDLDKLKKPTFYRCNVCDVDGEGEVCWMCGENDLEWSYLYRWPAAGASGGFQDFVFAKDHPEGPDYKPLISD